MQDNVWDTNTIPDAILVSFPYALGMTIVFKPSGIASVLTAQIINVLENMSSKIVKTPINNNGNTKSLRNVTA